MKTRTILSVVFLAIGLAAGWMAWLTWRAGDEGKWLFGIFAAFFLLLAAAPFFPAPKTKKEPEKVLGTRFAPAWQTEGMLLLVLVVIVASVVTHCAHLGK
jgi:hypothetical protein